MTARAGGRARRSIAGLLAAALVLAGSLRFVVSALWPAAQQLTGDFATAFPNRYFSHLRPDFVTDQVLPGWTYGPMLHVLTLPLFLVPRWSWVPGVWASINLIALVANFWLVCRLSGETPGVRPAGIAMLAGLWLLFQPLLNCFVMGNIEIIEMAILLGALVALQRARDVRAGVLLAIATMTKFLPIGFVGWLLLRRRWRAAAVALALVGLIALVTAYTLDWRSSVSFRLAKEPALSGVTELSVTSLFLHWTGLFDSHNLTVRWFPPSRVTVARAAGQIASVLIGAAYGVLLLVRRRASTALEVSVLFMAMFMVLPWNHDYYYVFSLVPVSVLWLRALARRDWMLLSITLAAYLMMSPPLPFSWIDRQHWFSLPFVFVLNLRSVPIFGALLLWLVATHEMVNEPRAARVSPVPIGHRLLRVTATAGLIVVPLFCGAIYFAIKAPPRDEGVYVEVDAGTPSGFLLYPLSRMRPENATLAGAPATELPPVVPLNKIIALFIVGRQASEATANASSAQLYAFADEATAGASASAGLSLSARIKQVNPLAYRVVAGDPGWPLREMYRQHPNALFAVRVGNPSDGSSAMYLARIGPPE